MIDRDNAVQSGKTARTTLASVLVTPRLNYATSSATSRPGAAPGPAHSWPARAGRTG